MIYVWAIIISAVVTILFDMIYSKIQHEREVKKSWQALNDQLEREGRPRLDQMERDDEGK
jgi:flagellar biosynthesis protein FlhB